MNTADITYVTGRYDRPVIHTIRVSNLSVEGEHVMVRNSKGHTVHAIHRSRIREIKERPDDANA